MSARQEMDLDEFVNWDNATSTGDYTLFPENHELIDNDPSLSMDLALENVNDDEFGFFALQRFNDDHAPPPVVSNVDAQLSTLPNQVDSSGNPRFPCSCLDTPPFPCGNCVSGGYQCKTIREGKYTGFCTSCVALGFQCSFGDTRAPLFSEPPNLGQLSWAARLEEQALPNLQVDNEPEKPANAYDQPPQLTSAGAPPPLVAPKPMNPNLGQQPSAPVGKVGARLSRESIRILRQWLSTHTRHPYPSDEEKDILQRQTGLTKTQITNWLANARRRHKISLPRSTSPHVGSSFPQDIPARRGTPTVERNLSLQRWVDSPPENEPASAMAIARAVTASTVSSSDQASPFSSHFYTDDGSGRSIHESSASSVGTSQSSAHSNGSAWSHSSARHSFGSFGSIGRSRRRRRRRNAPKHTDEKTSLMPKVKTYQCTFCTQTFKTKHDWGRHEKSLHLSLERWVCSNLGPRALKADINKMACVFCGEPEPSDAHIESHNHSACLEKPLDARTFYRKDHLNQHLKLVHNVKFVDWSMKHWKVATPAIRSRCGFCNVVLDSWSIRVDHLAEHFKMGYGMEDWKGGWGFDPPVLDLVENSIPPYLIHSERYTPLPYAAGDSPPETPRSAYELIKLELDYFIKNKESKTPPDDDKLQLEACRIVFASEVLALQGIASTVSWLRDIVMSSEELANQAKFGPLRSQAENRLATLKINGKDNLFEACPLERELQEFAHSKQLLGLTPMDDELQEEACCIVGKQEETSTHPSETVANWLIRRIKASTGWLAPFRQRAHLPRSEDITNLKQRSTDKSNIDSTVHNYSRLELELGEYLDVQRARGVEPTDEDLQRQARIIIYEIEDGWNQTAADSKAWLEAFRRRHGQRAQEDVIQSGQVPGVALPGTSQPSPQLQLPASRLDPTQESYHREAEAAAGLETPHTKYGRLFFNDANCYLRLSKDLRKWVASVMSPNNPNQHVPSDEELQHQARWLMYDDDDPWNQTAADNPEWLKRFKVDAGIEKDGPGLPDMGGWDMIPDDLNISPFGFPGARRSGPTFADSLQATGSMRSVDRSSRAAPVRYPPPTKVFRSRKLEEGLAGLVRHKAECGAFPSDEELRARGRVILGMEKTAADEQALLERFKEMMGKEVGVGVAAGTTGQGLGRVSAMMGPGAAAGPGPAGRWQGSPVIGPGPGLGSGGAGAMGGPGVVGGEGLMMMGMGAGTGSMMGAGAGAGMDMDVSGDMNNALMQDLNFDFVFDTPDATMGGPG